MLYVYAEILSHELLLYSGYRLKDMWSWIWIDLSISIKDTYRTFSEWSLQAVSAVFHRIAKWPAIRGLLPPLSPSPLRQMNWPGEIAGNGKEREGAGY